MLFKNKKYFNSLCLFIFIIPITTLNSCLFTADNRTLDKNYTWTISAPFQMFFVTQKTNTPNSTSMNPGYLQKDSESERLNIMAYVPTNGSSYVKFNYQYYDTSISVCDFQNRLGAGHIKNSVDTTVRVWFFSYNIPELGWLEEFSGMTVNISIREISDEELQQYL